VVFFSEKGAGNGQEEVKIGRKVVKIGRKTCSFANKKREKHG
jgi:hypothetical protein